MPLRGIDDRGFSATRAEPPCGKGEEARLLCERRASHTAASSRSAGGAAAGCSGRSSHAPAHHRAQPAHAAGCWWSGTQAASQWHRTRSCTTHLHAGWRHGWHPPNRWSPPPAVQAQTGALHTAGACGGRAAHWQSMGHRAWLEAQLQAGRSYSSASSYYASVPAAAASAAQSARQAWNSYARAAYTPKLPGWFRSRLPEMPEGALAPHMVQLPGGQSRRMCMLILAQAHATYAAWPDVLRSPCRPPPGGFHSCMCMQ